MQLSLRELAAAVAGRRVSAQAVTEAFLQRIAAVEPGIQAWSTIDPEHALAQARAVDLALDAGHDRSGPPRQLIGVPVGVKDLMDTADLPTGYGSPIYRAHRPTVDAAAVAQCRAAGAVILGKTVSTEFATFQPGPTRNPCAPADAPRTPGGSSSGSAAAVAAGMVPVAFGTQTAGSIVRPAAYCGVVGYKPTHGLLSLAGVKALAPSLDTLGVLAHTVDDVAYFTAVLLRTSSALAATSWAAELAPAGRLRVGICRTPHWDQATPDARRALSEAAALFEQAGAEVAEITLPAVFDGLTAAQVDIMAYEALAAFAPERRTQAAQFSAAFADFLAAGSRVTGEQAVAAYRQAEEARMALQALFAGSDVLIAPSAEGEAPAGLQTTGNPLFNRMWTLLGVPCVHVPLGVGATGMPIGVTVIGPRWADGRTLAAADLLQRRAAQPFA